MSELNIKVNIDYVAVFNFLQGVLTVVLMFFF